MRPQISWSDLAGRRVGIFGLGVEGLANLRAGMVRNLDLVLVDDHPSPEMLAGTPGLDRVTVLATGSGGLEALSGCDVIVKAPGIPLYGAWRQQLQARGPEPAIVSGLGMWLMEADRSRVLTITGTKGKSTTTSIVGHLLSRFGYRVFIGGNLGVPPQDPLVEGEFDYWIIEVSSYQAALLPVTTPVAAVTSLDQDHLPWHGGADRYFADKLSMTTQPGGRITVANGDSALLRSFVESLAPMVRWVTLADEPDTWTVPLNLLGEHNRRNALIAAACLQELGVPEASDPAALLEAAHGFGGLSSRLEKVAEVDGVTFVDDGLSTNVLPVLAAVDSFPGRRVALLVGGQSRDIDYRPLAVGLRSREWPLLVVTMPTNGPDIHRQLAEVGLGEQVSVVDTESLEDAVRAAFHWCRPDGVVLLSPAAPSFDRFRDYKHRREVFLATIATLI